MLQRINNLPAFFALQVAKWGILIFQICGIPCYIYDITNLQFAEFAEGIDLFEVHVDRAGILNGDSRQTVFVRFKHKFKVDHIINELELEIPERRRILQG